MAHSVPQDESYSSVGSVGVAGLAPAGQTGAKTVGGRDRDPPDSEICISDSGATDHIISDPRFVYD